MAANTTTKVAVQTGAAKDDVFSSINEDRLHGVLDVLANDPGAARLYSLTQNPVASTATMAILSSARSALGATITIKADGTLDYDGSTIAFDLQTLAAGETRIDSFQYTVRMANGALSTATASVLIGGVNDAPTLAGVAASTIEDSAAKDAPATISASLVGKDIDNNSVLTYSGNAQNEFGSLTVNADGTYAFAVNADALNALNAGVNANLVFAVTVADQFGASATTNLAFNLIGANDTAVVSGDKTGAISEDDGGIVAGRLSVVDRDAGQSLFQDGAHIQGVYGSFSFDARSGAWSYALDNTSSKVQGLNQGATVFDALTVASLDGTDGATIQVTITGRNDVATMGGDAAGQVTEDGAARIVGTLVVSDVDTGEAGFAPVNGLHGQYGDFAFDAASGQWTYTLNNGASNVQALGANVIAHEALTLSSIDGTASTTVDVSIVGSNDVAQIGGSASGAVKEDGSLNTSGVLTIADADSGEAGLVLVSDLTGTYGDFSFDAASGAWSYALRNDAVNVQALGASDHVIETLTIKSLDGSAVQTITVTVDGAQEPAPMPANNPHQTENTVTNYKVTNGTTNINSQNLFTGFDSNDMLVYANNFDFTGFNAIDTNQDGLADSTLVHFVFHGQTVDVTLVGYIGLSNTQIASASGLIA